MGKKKLPMDQNQHIYQYPAYYEIGFGDSNIEEKIEFILQCYQKSTGKLPLRVLDCGCGTGQHLEIIGKKGIATGGFDLSPQMVKYARKRLSRLDGESRIFEGDLQKFATEVKYDLAICLNGSFQYLIEVEDVVEHLNCAADALVDHGLYFISLPCPEELVNNPPGSIDSRWKAKRMGVEVEVNFTYKQDSIDWSRQTFSGLGKVKVTEGHDVKYLDIPYCYRIFFPREIEALAELSRRFQVSSTYCGYNFHGNCSRGGQGTALNILLKKTH